MGLDVYPAGRAKPGCEIEWAKSIQTLYDGDEETEEAAQRRFALSIEPWEDIGAPRVGYDAAANAWTLTAPDRDKSMTDEEVLKDMHGFYVLELLRGKCDGVSNYTHAGMYKVDETSFRGSFLEACEDLIGNELLVTAWTDCMRPEEAIEYGTELLAAAERAARGRIGLVSSPKPARAGVQRTGLLQISVASEGGTPSVSDEDEELTLDEKIDILRSAGRWYIFWGKRGHPIVAWF
jgi:hypothetical protein